MAPDSTPPISAKSKPQKSGPLDTFPAPVRDAHARFLATGDLDALDTVVLAIVRDHQPERARASTPAVLPDSARLIGDLGFDSIALAEIVFFIEDLYSVSVTNTELMSIGTVGELRGFIRTKVPAGGITRQPPAN
jgi:acyl carrier protein